MRAAWYGSQQFPIQLVQPFKLNAYDCLLKFPHIFHSTLSEPQTQSNNCTYIVKFGRKGEWTLQGLWDDTRIHVVATRMTRETCLCRLGWYENPSMTSRMMRESLNGFSDDARRRQNGDSHHPVWPRCPHAAFFYCMMLSFSTWIEMRNYTPVCFGLH